MLAVVPVDRKGKETVEKVASPKPPAALTVAPSKKEPLPAPPLGKGAEPGAITSESEPGAITSGSEPGAITSEYWDMPAAVPADVDA